ncbi:MAG: hypothetical protein KIT46_10225 [Anaerolineales bacterium]|nr:hypothetical protein [Anaerolineales bacterium]MCW5856407.1 hypothetical protein [Anaerolineales bacterium]
METTFAYLAVLILAGLAVFQLLLVVGRPLGRFAWGGQHEVLPANLRAGSLISIGLYALFALVILAQVGLVSPGFDLPGWAIWALAAYFTLGVLMNAISRSKPERNLMTPIALLLALVCWFLVL